MSYPGKLLSILLFVFVLFAACGGDVGYPSLYGTWHGEYASTLRVSGDAVDFGWYSGEVVEANESLGYLVFMYTNNPACPEQHGRYNKLVLEVVRVGTPAVIRYSEGYAAEAATTNASGVFIAWPDAASVAGRTDIFAWYTFATNQ